jgi:transposase-like protein
VDDGMKKAAYLGLIYRPTSAHAGKEYATMQNSIDQTDSEQGIGSYRFPTANPAVVDALNEVLRHGARQMLIQAVETEAAAWIDEHAHVTDDRSRRQVVRNGHASPRKILTGVGELEVQMPRVHDRRPPGQKQRFTSKILPPYLRKAKSINELIPWLYLKGISTGDFGESLQALVGPDCPGLSASTVTRLISTWQDEYAGWSKRDLSDKHYVYVWADGIHFNVRLEEDRTCILVLIGATADGRKELIAVTDGYRESEQSWKNLLLDVKQRGLTIDPQLATADGALGFWAAVRKVWPATREQRCWVHKTANVLNELPKRLQPEAKDRIHQIWMAPTREAAHEAFDHFVEVYGAKYPKAVECLTKDRDALLTFYDFPAEHWKHLRTTNPIESTFATVRLRHRRTKGNGSRRACLAMVFRLCQSAERRWRRLNGHELIEDVIAGVTFTDGEKQQAA